MGPFMAILTSDTVRLRGAVLPERAQAILMKQCGDRVRAVLQISPDFLKKFAQIPTLTNAVVDPDITYFCAFNFPGASCAACFDCSAFLLPRNIPKF